ncbi:MAG: hypothetical protein HQL34_14105, partial [Alphaproteobacteria bacterium]|nr:hypothetical protein [Alphaproteobacteria bacterium]
GGGGPASNRWQMHCQDRWLARARPRIVVWPWENHAWERAFCRSARRAGVTTLGHQHTVIGRHQINYAVTGNPDGLTSVPDRVAANGPAYRDELERWGVPAERLRIGGAFRIARAGANLHDPSGPVFVPLSATPELAALQVEAARIVAASDRRVLVKEHPMYPFAFSETATLARTDIPLLRHSGLSAVIYASGTSGLEGLLAGVPSVRLLGEERISIDVLPGTVAGLSSALAATLDEVLPVLAAAAPPAPLAWDEVFAEPDMNFWRGTLGDGISPEANRT